MDKRTLAALKGSIRKWQEIVWGGGHDYGSDNCPLCHMFVAGRGVRICVGCPVYERVGATGCERTPYQRWSRAYVKAIGAFAHPKFVVDDATHRAAKAELAFLQSLLPEGR